LAITSLTSCGRSVGIVRSRIQATEFKFFLGVQISLPFYGTKRFIYRVSILIVSHINPFYNPNSISLRSILILSFHILLGTSRVCPACILLVSPMHDTLYTHLYRLCLIFLIRLGAYLRTCPISFGQPSVRETSSLRYTDPQRNRQVHWPGNRRQNSQIIGDAGNGPIVAFLAPLCSHIYTLFPFRKEAKLETLNPVLLCKLFKGFSKGIFRPNTDVFQFLFSYRSRFLFDFILNNNSTVSQNFRVFVNLLLFLCLHLLTILFDFILPNNSTVFQNFRVFVNLLLFLTLTYDIYACIS
jgi:hypothetical protein